MNVYELTEKLGGEIVRGRARIRVGADYTIIGQLNGDNMEYTEAGRLLAAEQTEDNKSKRGRPPKAAVVESEQAVEPVTVETVSEEVPSPTVETAVPQDLFE
jgi:hypothetical protein